VLIVGYDKWSKYFSFMVKFCGNYLHQIFPFQATCTRKIASAFIRTSFLVSSMTIFISPFEKNDDGSYKVNCTIPIIPIIRNTELKKNVVDLMLKKKQTNC